MNSRADLAVYNSEGVLKIVVEIKGRHGTTSEWATHTRRNMAAHGNLSNVDYFIIATQDRLYMWKESGIEPDLVPPTYEADLRSELAPYYEVSYLDNNDISEYALELLIATWLNDISQSTLVAGRERTVENWISESGLMNAAENGRIEFEATV